MDRIRIDVDFQDIVVGDRVVYRLARPTGVIMGGGKVKGLTRTEGGSIILLWVEGHPAGLSEWNFRKGLRDVERFQKDVDRPPEPCKMSHIREQLEQQLAYHKQESTKIAAALALLK